MNFELKFKLFILINYIYYFKRLQIFEINKIYFINININKYYHLIFILI